MRDWIDSGAPLDLALSWHEVSLAIARQFPTAPAGCPSPLIASLPAPHSPTQMFVMFFLVVEQKTNVSSLFWVNNFANNIIPA